MQKWVRGSLISVVALGSAILSMGATANPPGVPVGEAPLSCTTVDHKGGGNNYKIEAIVGANGEFPIPVACVNATGEKCVDYGYTITSLSGETISQSLFAISADQELDSASPAPAYVASPGDGDSTTGFLEYARHEYPVRFNKRDTTYDAHILIRGSSSPRLATAYIRGGKIDESCLIAGPGVVGDPWETKTASEDVVAAGGKCAATLHYSGNGKLVNVSLPQGSPCFAGKIPDGALAVLGGEKIRNVGGGKLKDVPITFGDGTTTMYLPSGWAICTAAPCPGTTTYVYW
jgi:hypothetical protein